VRVVFCETRCTGGVAFHLCRDPQAHLCPLKHFLVLFPHFLYGRVLTDFCQRPIMGIPRRPQTLVVTPISDIEPIPQIAGDIGVK